MAYPNHFAQTHLAGELLREHAETAADELERLQPVVALAGRLMQKAAQGSASHGVLQDRSGRIVLLVSDDATGKANHAAYAAWRAGDIIGVSGMLCRLAGGELAVRAHEIERLVAASRPLSEGHTGLRYLDLITDEHTRSVFHIHSRLIAGVRAFLGGTAYIEVETPILQAAPTPGAAQFRTHHNALDHELHLRSSGELYLKQLLVGGVEKLYEINRRFRNDASASAHDPEGTLLEIYCAYSSYLYMMALLEQVLARAVHHALGTTTVPWQGQTLEIGRRFERITADSAGAKPLLQPTYVLDFPAAAAPFARRKDAAPGLAEQFELHLGGHKIAQGRSELNDPEEVGARYDAEFTRAVEYGLPPSSGVALSIDRLVMVLTDSPSPRDVILFPAHAER